MPPSIFVHLSLAAVARFSWDQIVVLSGKVEMREVAQEEEENKSEADITVIVDAAVEFSGPDTQLPKHGYTNAPPPRSASAVTITVPLGLPSAKLVSLNSLLSAHQGKTPANLEFLKNGTSKILPLPYGLDWSDELQEQIASLLKS